MSFTNSRKQLFALVDCNNFYASCERLFRPDLENKPIVVLSNNDGCIVSRSSEAKALGIPMGEPEYKARSLLKKHHVAVFSSNYALYGDISHRVMATLESLVSQEHRSIVEQYSIDEAFVRLDAALAPNAEELALAMRQRVRQWTSIHVSVGVAPTRTLAKLANNLAKKQCNGVVLIGFDPHQHNTILQTVPVDDVWGIGRKQAAKCHARGLDTALHLKEADDLWLKKHLTIAGWQTAMELRGIPCLGMNKAPVPRKTLVSSRSFGHKIPDKAALHEALSTFAARAAQRLRRENLVASAMVVHIRTSHHTEHPCHDETVLVSFWQPTCDTLALMNAAQLGLNKLYKNGYFYAKAGVMLVGLEDQNRIQRSLWDLLEPNTPNHALNTTRAGNIGNIGNMGSARNMGSISHINDPEMSGSPLVLPAIQESPNRHKLNATLDAINHRYGKRTLHFGAEGADKAAWHMRQQHCSPRATTEWKELPLASLS